MEIENMNWVQLRECESLSDDVREVLKALDGPRIKLYEVWIVPDEKFNPEVMVKYGYFIYPSCDLITILNEKDRIQINNDYIAIHDSHNITTDLTIEKNSVSEEVLEVKTNKRSFFDEMFDDAYKEEEHRNGFLDDALPDQEETTLESIENTLVWSELERKAELCRKQLDDQYQTYKNLTTKTIYSILTSSKHHESIAYLNACKCSHGATSFIRMTELKKLFNFDIPPVNMENFAIDLGRMVIYFHMDTISGGFDDVHFNRYSYNNASKGEMKFYDKASNYSLIEYDKWEDRLSDKPVLVFGYVPTKVNEAGLVLYDTEPPYVFLGSHECSAFPIEEGFRLNLCHSYDLPI